MWFTWFLYEVLGNSRVFCQEEIAILKKGKVCKWEKCFFVFSQSSLDSGLYSVVSYPRQWVRYRMDSTSPFIPQYPISILNYFFKLINDNVERIYSHDDFRRHANSVVSNKMEGFEERNSTWWDVDEYFQSSYSVNIIHREFFWFNLCFIGNICNSIQCFLVFST